MLKKSGKITVISALFFAIFCSFEQFSSAEIDKNYAKSDNNKSIIELPNKDPELEITPLAYSKYWTKAAWYIINKAGNSWYTKSPTVSYGSNVDFVSSGSIAFNSSNYGASTKHIVTRLDSNDEIDVVPETSLVNYASKISVIITDPSGKDVLSHSVTPQQHTTYKGSLGTYTVRFVQNSAQTWNLWIALWHYTGNIACSTPPCPEQTSLSNSKMKHKNGDIVELLNTKNNALFKNEYINGGFYAIPSKQHVIEDTLYNFSPSQTYSVKYLQNLGYDKELDLLVKNFKGLSIGDIINFEDDIQSIRYSPSDNTTYFGFEELDGNLTEWPFKGDLTNSYQIGDKLLLNLNVVEEVEGKEYETLDYIKYGLEHNGDAPDINLFLSN
ncbi:hypothetical protein [Lysinibacillus sp. 54212]|uniref:hypothetical protein n=1 Tax=Lysinibacillus sp. 54212 TaxID=3119829 RepID=UPI002FCB00E4